MVSEVSKTQIDRLGDRLKKGNITEADLRLLDQYRLSFSEAYEFVVGAIRTKLALELTGRPAKSTTSISEKLLRESIRLTQVQDIAGCRLVVLGITDQELVVDSLSELFDNVTIVDRREQPSHGYRAVHVIVKNVDKQVEIQVRTLLQHVWAELSEKLSDVVDPAIKYGGGDQSFLSILSKSSDVVAQEETVELQLEDHKKLVSRLLARASLAQDPQKELVDLQREIVDAQNKQISLREATFRILRDAIDKVPTRGGE